MNLEDLQRNWERLARDDPLWAILTNPEKKGRKWDLKSFFATGQAEVETILGRIGQLGKDIKQGKALDFGCGAGRLTLGLADRFSEVVGIDISPTMIELAKKLVKRNNCQFVVNIRDDLSAFQDDEFDFAISLITLQHMNPSYSIKYLKEFFRILAPGGCLCVQLIDSFDMEAGEDSSRLVPEIYKILGQLGPRLYHFRAEHRDLDFPYRLRRWRKSRMPRMETYAIPREQICELIANSGGRIIASDLTHVSGCLSRRYFAEKL